MNAKNLRLPSVAHWYDGFSPKMSTRSCCMRCFKSMPPDKLLVCNLCGVYQFCSEECREKGKHSTDKYCQKLQQRRRAVEALEQNADLLTFYHAENVGKFRKNRVAYTYLRERDKLVDAIYDIACRYHISVHWEEMIAIVQENLRLCHLNPQRAWCMKFSAFLLHGGRVDDAISFSQYTINRFSSKQQDSLHEGSCEGDWIYGNHDEMKKREMKMDWCNTCTDIFFVFIVYLAKLKQIMTYTFIRQAIGALLTSDFGMEMEAMQGPLALLLEYIIPFKSMKVTNWDAFLEQCSHLHTELMGLTEVIYDMDANLFKFMKQNTDDNHNRPGPIKKPPASQMNAFQTVKMCQYSLESIPDLQLWLKYCERHLSSKKKFNVIL